MALQIDLSRSPYFDDFDANANFYQVLFRPGTAVQTRELNAMQSILQDQISKFGRNLIKDGSVTEGCAFTFDNNYQFVKINDNYANGTAFTIANFIGDYVYNSNGLKARVVNATQGFQSQDPNLNTLYIKYVNTATYPNGSPQSVFANNENLVVSTSANIAIGNVTVATSANGVTGTGYAFTTTSGTIFKDGYFINVLPQTILVSPYNNFPDNISVGFQAAENIITPEANSSLYDNASGSPNYLAPGAHRLQLIPTLVTRQTNDTSNTTSFFSLCDFVAGYPVSIKANTQYAAIEDEMAKRTYETNGDFVVSPFILSTQPKSVTNTTSNTTYLNLVSSRGEGYVEGYNVDFINNNIVPLRKATDQQSFTGAVVTANYGYYVIAQEYVGDFQTNTLQQVQLHSVAKSAVSSGSFLGVSYSSSTQIGTAYIRGIEYNSGTTGTPTAQYVIYLFNVQMYPGYNFYNVKSIINYNNSSLNGVADIFLTINPANTSSNGAFIQQSNYNTMIFPFSQKALVANGFSSAQFVYRRANTVSFATNGTGTINLPASAKPSATEVMNQSGYETGQTTTPFIVIPSVNGSTPAKAGNVSITSGQSNVVFTVSGTSTQFLSDYTVGDWININGQIKQINNISNSTLLTVSSNFSVTNTNSTHAKYFPAGVPVDFTKIIGANTRSINTASSNSATFNLGESLSSTMAATVYYDVLRQSASPIKKILNSNVYVAINCASHSSGSAGPWSLGLADIYKINAIYVNSGTFSNTVTNSLTSFTFDNGQRDNYYGLAQISSIGNSLNANSRILVDLSVFTYDQSSGVGFFTANSYPIDDANTANTNAIQTQYIPQYKATTGSVYDLRDSVDFRPFANNTSNILANSTNWSTTATINPSANLIYYVDTSGSSGGPYIPTPDTNFQSNIKNYYPRVDLAVLTTSGKFQVIEGTPAVNPSQPPKPNGVMTLGVVNVPPYPSLSSPEAAASGRYDYAVTATLTQNKRYTMKDINSLASKINNLEYYTSLSLLEQSATNLLVRSGTTGQNRFQNGILVDPFHDHSIGNTLDPTYNIAIDSTAGNMRPKFAQRQRAIYYNADASSNTVKVGKYVMLNYTENAYLSQPYASKYRNCIEGNIFHWNGNISFDPPGATNPDLTTSPDVVTNLDLASNWVNLAAAFGTQWGNWNTIAVTNTVIGSSSTTPVTSDQNGNILSTYNTTTTTQTNTQQTRSGTAWTADINTQNYNLGSYVTNVSILPYVQPAVIKVTATGLKPNTRLYSFVNNKNVSGYVVGANSTFGTSNAYGSAVYSSNNGTVYAIWTVPPKTFTATTLNFQFVDVSDIIVGANAITTQASGSFYGTNLTISKGSSILSAREATLNINQVQQSQNVISTSSATTTTVDIIGTYLVDPPNGGGGGWQSYSCGHDQDLARSVVSDVNKFLGISDNYTNQCDKVEV
jgi:hypothetical protein